MAGEGQYPDESLEVVLDPVLDLLVDVLHTDGHLSPEKSRQPLRLGHLSHRLHFQFRGRSAFH